jgi:hypothetical protein
VCEGVGTHGLTGLGPADSHSGPPARLLPEVLVERDDTVDVGPGQVQLLGDDGDRLRIDVPILRLDRVQDRQQSPALTAMRGDYLPHPIAHPVLHVRTSLPGGETSSRP